MATSRAEVVIRAEWRWYVAAARCKAAIALFLGDDQMWQEAMMQLRQLMGVE
jgi:hypothetical protein